MANSTSIRYAEVKSAVSDLDSVYLSKMRNIFSDFEKTMKRVGGQDAFVGDASESLQSRFNKLSEKFSEFEQLVKDFASSFSAASEATETLEKQLAEQAGNLDT